MLCFGHRPVDLGMRSMYIPFLSSQEDLLVLRAEQAREWGGRGGFPPVVRSGIPLGGHRRAHFTQSVEQHFWGSQKVIPKRSLF